MLLHVCLRPEHILLKADLEVSWAYLTKASLAMWASSCSWISLLSSSSLARSASSRSCFSLCSRCLSTWTTDIWSAFRGADLVSCLLNDGERPPFHWLPVFWPSLLWPEPSSAGPPASPPTGGAWTDHGSQCTAGGSAPGKKSKKWPRTSCYHECLHHGAVH